MDLALSPTPQRLSTHALFRSGNRRIHVNTPLHDGDVPLHDHDFFECALVRSGSAIHRHLSGQLAAQADMVVWLPPGHWHAWEQCHHLRLFNMCLSTELLDHELTWCVDDPRLGSLWSDSAVRCWQLSDDASRQLASVMEQLQQVQDRDHIAAIGLVLISLSALVDALPPSEQGALPDALVRQLRVSMRRKLSHDWSLDELAEQAELEPSYLGRRFRRATGSSPMQWLARQRCEQAAIALLTTDQAVADIGRQFGWSDPNYFARIFRRHFDCSPSVYRQRRPAAVQKPRCSIDHWLQW